MLQALVFATLLVVVAAYSRTAESTATNQPVTWQAQTGEPQQEPALDSATVTPVAAWDNQTDGPQWTSLLLRALEENGTKLVATDPMDIIEFCPSFAALDRSGRNRFYVALISKMAEFESSFDPDTSFQEPFKDAQGRPVISRGLLQLSIESANAYPGCKLNDAKELHDPGTNLHCAVAILDRLVSRDQVIGRNIAGKWRGGAAYWSVLRQTSPRRARIETFTRKLDFCVNG